jgi:hypothetical protein
MAFVPSQAHDDQHGHQVMFYQHRLAMMVAMNIYKTIVSESSFDEIRPHFTKAAQLQGAATEDLSESTWRAKREEVA